MRLAGLLDAALADETLRTYLVTVGGPVLVWAIMYRHHLQRTKKLVNENAALRRSHIEAVQKKRALFDRRCDESAGRVDALIADVTAAKSLDGNAATAWANARQSRNEVARFLNSEVIPAWVEWLEMGAVSVSKPAAIEAFLCERVQKSARRFAGHLEILNAPQFIEHPNCPPAYVASSRFGPVRELIAQLPWWRRKVGRQTLAMLEVLSEDEP